MVKKQIKRRNDPDQKKQLIRKFKYPGMDMGAGIHKIPKIKPELTENSVK